jgi:hypothetical protein
MDPDSHYHRQPGISPVRITVYPKRRLSDLPSGLRTIPAEKPIELPRDYSASYADFFRQGTSAPMTRFRHVVDDRAVEPADEQDLAAGA